MNNDRNEKLIKRLEKNAEVLKKTLETSLDSLSMVNEDLSKMRSKMTDEEKDLFDLTKQTMNEAFVEGDSSSLEKLKKTVDKWQVKNQ